MTVFVELLVILHRGVSVQERRVSLIRWRVALEDGIGKRKSEWRSNEKIGKICKKPLHSSDYGKEAPKFSETLQSIRTTLVYPYLVIY